MKKLVLTMVALVAMATTSFAQFSASELQMIEKVVNDYSSSYSVPSVSYSVPSVSYSVPSVTYSVPSTNWDNFSTKGNSNPFTGSTGHRARDYSRDAYNYGSGHTIHTGSRGGQYYYNSRGNKTYVPKRNLW